MPSIQVEDPETGQPVYVEWSGEGLPNRSQIAELAKSAREKMLAAQPKPLVPRLIDTFRAVSADLQATQKVAPAFGGELWAAKKAAEFAGAQFAKVRRPVDWSIGQALKMAAERSKAGLARPEVAAALGPEEAAAQSEANVRRLAAAERLIAGEGTLGTEFQAAQGAPATRGQAVRDTVLRTGIDFATDPATPLIGGLGKLGRLGAQLQYVLGAALTGGAGIGAVQRAGDVVALAKDGKLSSPEAAAAATDSVLNALLAGFGAHGVAKGWSTDTKLAALELKQAADYYAKRNGLSPDAAGKTFREALSSLGDNPDPRTPEFQRLVTELRGAGKKAQEEAGAFKMDFQTAKDTAAIARRQAEQAEAMGNFKEAASPDLAQRLATAVESARLEKAAVREQIAGQNPKVPPRVVDPRLAEPAVAQDAALATEKLTAAELAKKEADRTLGKAKAAVTRTEKQRGELPETPPEVADLVDRLGESVRRQQFARSFEWKPALRESRQKIASELTALRRRFVRGEMTADEYAQEADSIRAQKATPPSVKGVEFAPDELDALHTHIAASPDLTPFEAQRASAALNDLVGGSGRSSAADTATATSAREPGSATLGELFGKMRELRGEGVPEFAGFKDTGRADHLGQTRVGAGVRESHLNKTEALRQATEEVDFIGRTGEARQQEIHQRAAAKMVDAAIHEASHGPEGGHNPRQAAREADMLQALKSSGDYAASIRRLAAELAAPAEPPIPAGHTRLYRGNPTQATPEYIKNMTDPARTIGRWFGFSRQSAENYAHPFAEGDVVYVDVPTAELAKYQRGPLNPTKEVIVPREVANRAVSLTRPPVQPTPPVESTAGKPRKLITKGDVDLLNVAFGKRFLDAQYTRPFPERLASAKQRLERVKRATLPFENDYLAARNELALASKNLSASAKAAYKKAAAPWMSKIKASYDKRVEDVKAALIAEAAPKRQAYEKAVAERKEVGKAATRASHRGQELMDMLDPQTGKVGSVRPPSLTRQLTNMAADLAFSATRAVAASDIGSWIFRQGAMLSYHGLFTRPGQTSRTIGGGIADYFSKSRYNEVTRVAIDTHPAQALVKPMKLRLGNQGEGLYESGIAHKLPVIGEALVKPSERSFASLDKLRLDAASLWDKALREQGFTPETHPQMYERAGDLLNAFTGTSRFPKIGSLDLEKAAEFMGAVAFAPRYVYSTLSMPYKLARASATARPVAKLAAGPAASFAAAWAGTLLVGSMLGASVETDPRSSDFLKLKVGNTRFDLGRGLIQALVLGARMGTGEYKSSSTGEIERFASPRDIIEYARTNVWPKHPKGDTNALTLLYRFIESKEAPIPSYLSDVARGGKDIMGRPADLNPFTRFQPFAKRDIEEATKTEPATVPAVALASQFGIGAQSYTAKTTKTPDEIEAEKLRAQQAPTTPKTPDEQLAARVTKSVRAGHEAKIRRLLGKGDRIGAYKAWLEAKARGFSFPDLKKQIMVGYDNPENEDEE